MGLVCNISELGRVWNIYNHFPVISMQKTEITKDKFFDYDIISLGQILSSELLNCSKEEREKNVFCVLEKIFNRIQSKKMIIENIDILFNPKYNIDILGFFINLGRNAKIIVIWPGQFALESLVYANPGYADYRRYQVKDYNIICLI